MTGDADYVPELSELYDAERALLVMATHPFGGGKLLFASERNALLLRARRVAIADMPDEQKIEEFDKLGAALLEKLQARAEMAVVGG